MATASVTATVVTAVAVATMVMVAATSAAVSGLELFGGSVANSDNLAFEAYILAGKRMIEVHLYFIIGHFKHLSVETEAVGGHHRYVGTGLDVFCIKLSVDFKYVFVKFDNLLGVRHSESIGCIDLNVKFTTGSESVKCFLERRNYTTSHAEHDALGIFRINLVYKLFAVGIFYI